MEPAIARRPICSRSRVGLPATPAKVLGSFQSPSVERGDGPYRVHSAATVSIIDGRYRTTGSTKLDHHVASTLPRCAGSKSSHGIGMKPVGGAALL
jgi:hypothetical protein